MTDIAKMNRECSGCSLCCKLLPMHDSPEKRQEIVATIKLMIEHGMATLHDFRGMMPDFEKPAGESCPHQCAKGCRVYAARPFGCRMWSCRWLTGDDTADLRRPDRSRYVIDLVPDFIEIEDNDTGEKTPVEVVQIWCDPKHRDAWRDPDLLAYIERRGREGKAALIRFSGTDGMAVFPPSLCGDEQWHIHDRGKVLPERAPHERFDGIARAQHVKLDLGADGPTHQEQSKC